MPKRIGKSKYCNRNEVEVYNQPKKRHNEECKSCHDLYAAIKNYSVRVNYQRNICREAQRLALEEIMRIIAQSKVEINGLARIRETLESHPALSGGDINLAISKILKIIT